MDELSRTQLIQQKIKQRLQSRKRIASKQTSTQIKRLTSHQQYPQNPLQQKEQKPQSSMRLRTKKQSKPQYQQQKTQTTDSSNKNDIDVTRLVDEVFDKGFELEKYLKKMGLDCETAKTRLFSNNLFSSFVVSKLSKVEEDQYETVLQKEIIKKLEKISLMERQENSCLLIEKRISAFIDQRLRSLTNN